MRTVLNEFRRIAEILKEMCSRRSSKTSELADVFDVGRDNSPEMTPRYKIDTLHTDSDNSWAENSPGSANESVGAYHQPSGQDDDSEASARNGRYHEFISGTSAYTWLLSRLRQELDLSSSESDIMTGIRDTILSSLPPHRVSRKCSSETYTLIFEVDWNPRAFIEDQRYEVENGRAIGMVLTLTGSTKDAQALNCAEYLTQTWPLTGSRILQLVRDVVRSGAGSQDLPDNTKLTARMHNSKLIAEASGTAYSLAEIGEQLAWLGASLRLSPNKTGVVYCRPEISPIVTDRGQSSSSNGRWNLAFKFESEVQPQSQSNGCCWLNLFSNLVIVKGYPIPTRPEYNTGLEITLDVVSELIGAQHATIFKGSVFVKGFRAMLTLSKQSGDVSIWHLIVNHERSYISYSDPQVNASPSYNTDDIDLTSLVRARHIIGWCTDAKNDTGREELHPR